MPVEYVSGDLTVNRYDAELIALGMNCTGSMSTPLAQKVGGEFFDFYIAYRALCLVEPREFNLGTIYVWTLGEPAVAALGIIERPGGRASYDAIENVLQALVDEAEEYWVETIAMDLLGVGDHGRLDPERVKALIESVFDRWDGMVYVYEEFIDGE